MASSLSEEIKHHSLFQLCGAIHSAVRVSTGEADEIAPLHFAVFAVKHSAKKLQLQAAEGITQGTEAATRLIR
jgi:hypothetical protein